jgi:hypothetical protein
MFGILAADALGYFVSMNGNRSRRTDSELHFFAGDAKYFNSDPERRENYLVVATTRNNKHFNGFLWVLA